MTPARAPVPQTPHDSQIILMSTGAATQSSLLQESPKQDASSSSSSSSSSALHYLFQEVSKLTSPIHSSFIETGHTEDVLCPESVPHKPLSTLVKNVQSPLKVLSLINLQCERLLHQSEDDADHSSLLFFSDFGFSKPAEDLPDTAQPLNCESNSLRQSDSRLKKGCSPEDSETKKCPVSFPVKAEGAKSTADTPQTPELRFTVGLDLSSDWTEESLSTQHTFYDFLPEALCTDEHLSFSPDEALCASETSLPQDHNANICLSPDEALCASETSLPLDHNANICLSPDEALCASETSLPLDHNANICLSPDEALCASETSLPLDHNANICLSPDEPHKGPVESADSQFYPRSCSPSEQKPQNIKVTPGSACDDSSEDVPTPQTVGGGDEASAELTSAEKRTSASCEEQCALWRSKRRKQPRPSRSASVQDPDFQGVTFRMDTELDDAEGQCRLRITSQYSTDLPKSLKRTRLRTRTSQKSLKTSSDDDSDSASSEAKDKVCASCCTKKTPMWRDAEDGTPLCNACGIRYKKYRVRCINCWNIPKKDGNSVSRCSRCGHFVRLTSAQRRPTV
ncbi:GATA-type zinc finger protein 1 [Periophthalmus magnuspinnatus]|uniref:GATA-type zinc finger protein 1 n=1 Tax=Periophthalmus magnuspinnatus TaxID=409849 RepID=UPI002436A2C6|nr:GATA-type zinc finger protein 1 [Periophthalmus magnuspinnatus]